MFVLNNKKLRDGVRFAKCGECGRSGEPMGVGGNGKLGILVVFDQPTLEQWASRNWFAGSDSTILRSLQSVVSSPIDDCWVTAVMPCRDEKQKVIRYEVCLVNLERTIKKLHPRLIVAVGSLATGAVLRLYNQRHFGDEFTTGQYVGQCIPLLPTETGDWGCWLAPVQSDKELHANSSLAMQEVAKDWVVRNLRDAYEDSIKPPVVDSPNYELLYETDDIVKALKEASVCKYSAFDYETNCIQPESNGARILTASVAMGDSSGIFRTFAFPMASEVVKVGWRKFLQSSSHKIGANIKFEHRWSSVALGTPVVNWFWDVCVGGRLFDCMPGNAGLKFLTFVYFGVIGYDDDVSPFMKGDDEFNKLDQMPVEKLLTYNALDSFYTYKAAMFQHKLLGFDF